MPLPEREFFAVECAALERRVEQRRRRFVLVWRLGMLLAVFLLILGMGYSATVMQKLVVVLRRSNGASLAEIFAFSFFCLLGAGVAAVMPLLHFHGVGRGKIPFERRVWEAISTLLGECRPASLAMNCEQMARESGLFPADAGISERPGLTGTIGGLRYYMQEMAVTSAKGEGNGRCIFRGLFVVCERITLRHRLPAPPSRMRLLLLHQDYMDMAHLLALGWEKTEDITPVVSAATMLRVVAAELEPSLLPQTGAWEGLQALLPVAAIGRLPVALDIGMLRFGRKMMTRITERHAKPALASELAYARQFCAQADLHSAIHAEDNAFHEQFGAARIKGSYRLALPYRRNIFGPRSLFRRMDYVQDALFIYDILAWMQLLPEAEEQRG